MSAEDLSGLSAETYDVAFSNYVLEHVSDVDSAAQEICRVLKPGGSYISSVPNPMAPEFRVAGKTRLAFHKLVRGRQAWETHYMYGSIPNLIRTFEKAGFVLEKEFYRGCTEQYLERFFLLSTISRGYDRLVEMLGIKPFMGNVCLTMIRSGDACPVSVGQFAKVTNEVSG